MRSKQPVLGALGARVNALHAVAEAAAGKLGGSEAAYDVKRAATGAIGGINVVFDSPEDAYR